LVFKSVFVIFTPVCFSRQNFLFLNMTRMHLPEEAVRVDAVAHRTRRAATDVTAGAFRLDVIFSAPAGQKLDDRYGPSTRLLVSATPPELLVEGAGKGTDLFRDLVLDPTVPEGVLHVSAMAASCDEDTSENPNPYPACHVHQQDWGVPVRITPDGDSRLALVLAGIDHAAAGAADDAAGAAEADSAGAAQ